jgi:hypothetical protein
MNHPDKIFGRLGNRLFQMAYIYAQMKEGKIPDIYVQSPEYFDKYAEDIKRLFSEGIGHIPRTSIHVRRGSNPSNPDEPNYHENPFYVDLTATDYYERAIEMFPYESFVVFSDDPEWCKKKWGNDSRFKILEKGDEIEDFNLMASCQHNIVANSSFSWWAAYLNPNLGKKIVCPKDWFSDKIERTKCPQTWIKI